jgi:hypothetical protein
MKNIWNWVKNNPNRTMFLIPIILVAGISISHVVAWYDIANPINWAIYLSIAIEVGAMTALVAATNKIKGGVWFMFGMITIIQMIGNIFFSFKEINETGELFKSWVELTSPIWELFGTEPTDIIGLKRWLAFLEGGLLPIISLTSLHFFVKYEGNKKEEILTVKEETDSEILDEEPKEKIETEKIWETVKRLKEEGKLPTPTEEDIENEPTDLAFTPYLDEEIETEDTSEIYEESIELPVETEVEVEESLLKETLESEDIIPEIPTKSLKKSDIEEFEFDENLLDIFDNSEDLNLTDQEKEEILKDIENPKTPNDILISALKKYKESKGRSTIKRID